MTVRDFGTIKIELYPKIAPQTVDNFVNLVNQGFYNGLTFHRIMAGFMIQGGDPLGTGAGGPGYNIKGEFSANNFDNTLKHTKGVISMARQLDNYNSAGSQFFIMLVDYPSLDGDYAAFGKVIEGQDVVDKIGAVPVHGPAGSQPSIPDTPVVIDTVTVDTFGVTYDEPTKLNANG
ncbi:MAG: peptidylprolyl isomerase [Clostridiales bacterium]|nr:peptidylprolyl isomerase [Clostridiales bacterium]